MSRVLDTPGLGPVLTERDLRAIPTGCCYGELHHGPEGCTCWEPTFDDEQAEPDTSTRPKTRAKCCRDCAYRKGSPERVRGEGPDLRDLAGSPGRAFWCHQGMRLIVAWRHPDGRERPAHPGDYFPAIVNGVPYLADGTAGQRCAGWATIREGLLR